MLNGWLYSEIVNIFHLAWTDWNFFNKNICLLHVYRFLSREVLDLLFWRDGATNPTECLISCKILTKICCLLHVYRFKLPCLESLYIIFFLIRILKIFNKYVVCFMGTVLLWWFCLDRKSDRPSFNTIDQYS